LKVVLVDDSQAVLRSFGGLLASVPHVELIGCVQDVAAALALIDARRPDLVVLDLELRLGERGIDVARHAAQALPPTPVIVLSNTTRPAVRQELLSAGALACFDKCSEFLLARDWIATRAADLAAAARSGAADRS
jgi:DNA-binding NarL/FixJ family response regulator